MNYGNTVNQALQNLNFDQLIFSLIFFNIFFQHYLKFKNYNYICTRLGN